MFKKCLLNEGNTPSNTVERKEGKGDWLGIQLGHFQSTEDWGQTELQQAGRHSEERGEGYKEKV